MAIAALTEKPTGSFAKRPEVWGGIECTINRLADVYHDQLEYARHYERCQHDVAALIALGIKKVRYPVLWEKCQPSQEHPPDFSWVRQPLQQFREAGVAPVAGLVHHGSGPPYTSLADATFPEKLAEYAAQVATEFPWIEYYTPVNEPLTTARFSGLYGLWYPHSTEPAAFINMLLNQCRGVVLAMRAIRQVNPQAKLVQTEDLGKIYSTPLLRYQAEFENERRWLTFDLLCGKVVPGHPMYNYMEWLGINPADVHWFAENTCPPDVMGINHYITSERYLDQRVNRYPLISRGGNGRHVYADIEAVRSNAPRIGIRGLLREAWQRYKLPMAITEVHMHCTREEQLRWLYEVYNAAAEAMQQGAEVAGVTPWALLGSTGWNELLQMRNPVTETGALCMEGESRRCTALQDAITSLAHTGDFEHPVLASEGWWHRPIKNTFYPINQDIQVPLFLKAAIDQQPKAPILITGRTGTLGQAFARLCARRGLHHQLVGREIINICDPVSIEAAIAQYKPWAIVNAAGYVRVDEAEADREACIAANVDGPVHLAKACRHHGILFITFSSDLVFNGNKHEPYLEDDRTAPLSVYGQSKAQAEKQVLKAYHEALVIRTSAFFGPWDQYNFLHYTEEKMRNGEEMAVASDTIVSPTYVPDLVNASLDLLIDKANGLWHLSNGGEVSWYDLASEVVSRHKLTTTLLKPVSIDDLQLPAARPKYSVLSTVRGLELPSLDQALDKYFRKAV